jgi:hypothetical protein
LSTWPLKNPARPTGLSDEQTASIGNLLFVDEELNDKLKNRNFGDKKKLLVNSGVWMDDIINNATTWGAPEIEARAKFLADTSFKEVWCL